MLQARLQALDLPDLDLDLATQLLVLRRQVLEVRSPLVCVLGDVSRLISQETHPWRADSRQTDKQTSSLVFEPVVASSLEARIRDPCAGRSLLRMGLNYSSSETAR